MRALLYSVMMDASLRVVGSIAGACLFHDGVQNRTGYVGFGQRDTL